MTNKELVLKNINREIQENIDFNKELINKNKDNKDNQDYIKYVSKPLIALLELGKQYMNNHYDLIKPLENVFNTDKDVMNQLKDLTDNVHSFILSFCTEVECDLEDTFYDNDNLNINFNDIINQYIVKYM